jgi:hypothetical protein
MAQVDVFVNVEAEPCIAVPLAQGIIDAVQAKIGEAGHTLRRNKIKFLCERCGAPMVLRDKTLVCDDCLADMAIERQIEDAVPLFAPGPVQPAEAAVF